MEKPVEITRNEWARITSETHENSKEIKSHEKTLEQHWSRINEVEKQQIMLPMSIQKAVENGMAPVLKKVMDHDRSFAELELKKEREEKEKALYQIAEDKERRKWFVRTFIGSVLGSVGGVVGLIKVFFMLKN